MDKPKSALLQFFNKILFLLLFLSGSSQAADVLISTMFSTPPTGVINGSTFLETVEVTTVQGQGDSNSVVLSYTPPPGTTVQSVDISSDLGSPPPRSCNITVNPVICDLATVRDRPSPATDGERVTVEFTLLVNDPAITSTTVLTHNASVTAASDTNSANNSGSNNTTVIPGADVRLNSASYWTVPASGNAGIPLSVVITPRNFGPNAATNFTVETTLTGASPGSVSGSGSGYSCGAFSGSIISCTYSGSVAAPPLGVLDPTGVAAPSLTLSITPGTTGTLTVNSSVLATVTPADPNDGNNGILTADIPIGAGADLAITSLSAPSAVILASPFNYTFVASNNGPSNASSNTVTIPIPTGTTVNSITATGWSCTPTPPRSNPSTTSISCTRATFNNGATTTFTVNTTADTAGSKVFNPSISSSTAEVNPANNSATATTVAGNNADLAVNKSVSTSHAFVGNTFSYTITSQNNGPATVTGSVSDNLRIVDTLPANVRLDSISQSGGTATGFVWSCTPALPVTGPATVTCVPSSSGATVASGQTMPTLTFNMTAVGPTAPKSRSTVTNTAAISSSLTDPVAGNNSQSANITLYSNTGSGDGPGGTAELRIAKSDWANSALDIDLPEPVGLGQTFYYRLRVTNQNISGNNFFDLTSGILTVTDTLPAGLTLSNAEGVNSGDGWSCSPTSGSGPLTITCTRVLSTSNRFNEGSTSDIRLTVSGTVTGTVTNQSSLSYSGYDFAGSNTANESTQIQNKIVDLTISKSGSPASINATGLLTYTINVSNSSCPTCTGSTANAVRVVDELNNVFDADFSATASQGSCTVTDIAGTDIDRNKRVVCELGDLPFGNSATVTINVRPRNTGTRTNNAYAYTPNLVRDYFDPTTEFNNGDPSYVRDGTTGATGYNKATTTTTITAGADVRIQKTVNPTTGRGGTPFVFTLNVRNNGPSQATSLTVTDTLPTWGAVGSSQGFEFTGTSPFSSGGYNCTYTPGSDPNPNIGGTISCTRATLNNGNESNISISVRPTNFTGSSISVSNTGTVTASTPDGIATNNSSVVLATIEEAQADLSITKTDRPQSRDPAVVGDSYFYTLSITNNGPSRAQGVTVTDTLPTETGSSGLLASFVSATPAQGSCSPPVAGSLTCNLGNLAVGASTTVIVTMNANEKGTVNNTASVASATSVDPVAANNSEGENTTLRDPADLILTKTVDVSPVPARKLLTYTLTVQNAPSAPGTAFTSYVRDTLPLTATFISATPSQGSCPQQPAANAVITTGNQTLNCVLGTLAPGASATITVVLRAPNAVTTLTNTAIVNDVPTLNSEGLPYDAERDLTNNSASVVTQVIGYGIYGYVYQDLEPNGNKGATEDWSGTTPTVYVKLTARNSSGVCQSPALAVATVNSGSGEFAFPSPQGSPTGDYCLIVTNSAALTNITPAVPAGWLLTEPNNNIPVRVFTLGQGAVTNENFGFYQATIGGDVRLSGRVFEDNGRGGGIAHNGLVDGTERGLPVVTVSAYAGSSCSGTPQASTSTIANGSFDFFVPFSSPLTLCADTPSGFRSISENVGTTGASNSNVIDSAITFSPTAGTSYSGITFGKVGIPIFSPSYQRLVSPGGSESYGHTFYSTTAGSVVFSSSNQEIPVLNAWNQLLYRDDNCDDRVNPGELQITGSLSVTADTPLCLVNRVLAPPAAPYNSIYVNTITATFTYANTTETTVLIVEDRTTTGDALSSDLLLSKTVDKLAAYPGDTVTYTIRYEHQGAGIINNLVINDATPTFTTFVSAACGTLGSGLTGCSVSAQPSVGGRGAIAWQFTGNLNAGGQGTVIFVVKIND
jgi:uncharacterized repeat protein (TIGR01451 family)